MLAGFSSFFKKFRAHRTFFENYDNIVLMVGMLIDKVELNSALDSIVSARNQGVDAKILVTGIADLDILNMMIYKGNFGRRSPFCEKNLVMLYCNVPYAKNIYIDNVYLYVRKDKIDRKPSPPPGKWGWEGLSSVLFEILGQRDKDLEISIHGSKIKEKESILRYDTRDIELALQYLVRFAGPSSIQFRGFTGDSNGEIIISTQRIKHNGGYYEVEIPIKRFIPAFNEMLIEKELKKTLKVNGRTLFITIGGAEHNMYLVYLISKFRSRIDSQMIFDLSNKFDYTYYRSSADRGGKLFLLTHNYVGVVIYPESDPNKKICAIKPPAHRNYCPGESPLTAGIVAKLDPFKMSPSEIFGIRNDGLLVIFGSGVHGSLATKLTLAHLLFCEDEIDPGLYYMVIPEDTINAVMDYGNVSYNVKNLRRYLQNLELKKAYTMEQVFITII